MVMPFHLFLLLKGENKTGFPILMAEEKKKEKGGSDF